MSMNFGDPRLPQKFWARHEVTVNAGMSPCWTYTSYRGIGPNGRTIVKYGREKPTNNYRFTCDLEHGPLPTGKTCSHTCHNPLCANPEHVVYESLRENMARKGTTHPRAVEIFNAKLADVPSFKNQIANAKKSEKRAIRKYAKKRRAQNPEWAKEVDKDTWEKRKVRLEKHPELKAAERKRQLAWLNNKLKDPVHRAEVRARQRARYQNDPAYRAKQNAKSRAHYHAKKKRADKT